MKTTIDSAGRIVIPKSVRDAARLVPGMALVVTFRDGKVEIEPEPRSVGLVRRRTLLVAVPEEPGEFLSSDTVEATRDDLSGDRA